jgi:hypothetical protein
MNSSELAKRRERDDEGNKTALSPTTSYLGLCSTCKRAATCTYPRDPRRPILSCCEHEGREECEGSVSLALLSHGSIFGQPPELVATSLAAERDMRVDKGLCRNCANRGTCTFPRPEGGVWHCEEYQ